MKRKLSNVGLKSSRPDKKEPQGMEERRELKPVRLNQFRHGLDDGLVVSACEDAPASDWFLL